MENLLLLGFFEKYLDQLIFFASVSELDTRGEILLSSCPDVTEIGHFPCYLVFLQVSELNHLQSIENTGASSPGAGGE